MDSFGGKKLAQKKTNVNFAIAFNGTGLYPKYRNYTLQKLIQLLTWSLVFDEEEL